MGEDFKITAAVNGKPTIEEEQPELDLGLPPLEEEETEQSQNVEEEGSNLDEENEEQVESQDSEEENEEKFSEEEGGNDEVEKSILDDIYGEFEGGDESNLDDEEVSMFKTDKAQELEIENAKLKKELESLKSQPQPRVLGGLTADEEKLLNDEEYQAKFMDQLEDQGLNINQAMVRLMNTKENLKKKQADYVAQQEQQKQVLVDKFKYISEVAINLGYGKHDILKKALVEEIKRNPTAQNDPSDYAIAVLNSFTKVMAATNKRVSQSSKDKNKGKPEAPSMPHIGGKAGSKVSHESNSLEYKDMKKQYSKSELNYMKNNTHKGVRGVVTKVQI